MSALTDSDESLENFMGSLRSMAITVSDSEKLYNLKKLLNFDDVYGDLELVGEGAYGKVYKATDKHKKETVAIKVLYMNDPMIVKDYFREVEILKSIGDEIGSIPRYIDSFTYIDNKGRDMLAIVTEYINGDNLDTILEKMEAKGKTFPMDIIYRFSLWIFGVLESLHSRGIVHKDVKPANILVQKTPGYSYSNFYLVDFGFSCSIDPVKNLSCKTNRGTPLYMPPEVLVSTYHVISSISFNRELYDRVDIWAAAVTIVELANVEQVYLGEDGFAFTRYVLSKKIKLGPEYSHIAEVINKCLELRPQNRPTARQVLDELVLYMTKYI